MKDVVSLYDYTSGAVRVWAEAGYDCYCYDIQHEGVRVERVGDRRVIYVYADLYDEDTLRRIADKHKGNTVFGFAFPVCTDLAGSGALRWKGKAEKDPLFQHKAVGHVKMAAHVLGRLGCPWVVENPVGAVPRMWRKWDYKFDPCDYGGYLPEDDEHPRWPEVIPARDAYTKGTCLWTGGGFVMPVARPVEPVFIEITRGNGTTTRGSPQWAKLGGKSQRTKDIRSASPRGVFKAIFDANGG